MPPAYYSLVSPLPFTAPAEAHPQIGPTIKRALLTGVYLSKWILKFFKTLNLFSHCLIFTRTLLINFCPIQEKNTGNFNSTNRYLRSLCCISMLIFTITWRNLHSDVSSWEPKTKALRMFSITLILSLFFPSELKPHIPSAGFLAVSSVQVLHLWYIVIITKMTFKLQFKGDKRSFLCYAIRQF